MKKNRIHSIFLFSFSFLSFCFLPCFSKVEWGFSTSAYQIEGGWNEGGRMPSIWDTFCHTQPWKIVDRSNGDVACQEYSSYHHHHIRDIQWMHELDPRVRHYRFSISWSRWFPTWADHESQTPNENAVRYYQSIVDTCHNYSITPWITLFHWDLPQYFQDAPTFGWTNETFLPWAFTQYALSVMNTFPSVSRWLTINEPLTFVNLGYRQAMHAPGVTNEQKALQVQHSLIEAHRQTYQKAHERWGVNISISLALNVDFFEGTDSVSEQRAYEEMHHWLQPYLDPLLFPIPQLDYLALNTYSSTEISWGGSRWRPSPSSRPTASSWLHYSSSSVVGLLSFIGRAYGASLLSSYEVIISEHGISTYPWDVQDEETRGYPLQETLRHIDEAIKEKSSIWPFSHLSTILLWSFIDNFEWAAGYTECFGFLHVDRESGKRCEKSSVEIVFSNSSTNREFAYPSCTP